MPKACGQRRRPRNAVEGGTHSGSYSLQAAMLIGFAQRPGQPAVII